ncbi:MAG: DUF2799 domain-containing protein [Bdellovibrionaceae bacterium]|nr:DUF2799 domain-containing protein [Pseudobdellovibrionaceae bacterium]
MSFFILIFLCIGCSSQKTHDCQEADWFELGRRDGAMGKSQRFVNSELPLLCPSSNKEEEKKLFNIGRKVGLLQYCRPENAFELGKDGKEYENVCPEESHSSFLDFFRQGLQVRELQIVNQDIDNKLSILDQQLKATSPSGKSEMESQILKLKNLKSQNNRQVDNIQDKLKL